MKAKVFVTQVPSRRDKETGSFVPTVNIGPAAEHGEVITMMPPSAPFFATSDLVAQLRYHLRHYDYERGDSLICLGDPAIISVASGILAKDFGTYKILKWDRHVGRYLPAHIKI